MDADLKTRLDEIVHAGEDWEARCAAVLHPKQVRAPSVLVVCTWKTPLRNRRCGVSGYGATLCLQISLLPKKRGMSGESLYVRQAGLVGILQQSASDIICPRDEGELS